MALKKFTCGCTVNDGAHIPDSILFGEALSHFSGWECTPEQNPFYKDGCHYAWSEDGWIRWKADVVIDWFWETESYFDEEECGEDPVDDEDFFLEEAHLSPFKIGSIF